MLNCECVSIAIVFGPPPCLKAQDHMWPFVVAYGYGVGMGPKANGRRGVWNLDVRRHLARDEGDLLMHVIL